MSFAWIEYLDCARKLAATGSQADLRAAISRAYYAVYNTVHGTLAAYVQIPDNESKHRALWLEVDRLRAGPSKSLSLGGNSLKAQRHKADYELRKEPYTKSDAESAIRTADNLLKLLAEVMTKLKPRDS